MLTAYELDATLQLFLEGRGNHKQQGQRTSWLELAFSWYEHLLVPRRHICQTSVISLITKHMRLVDGIPISLEAWKST